METIDLIVIENILSRMGEMGINQKQLASLAAVSYEGLNRILNKHAPPSRATLQAVAKALGRPVEYFYQTNSNQGLTIDEARLLQAFRIAQPLRRALTMAAATDSPEDRETLRLVFENTTRNLDLTALAELQSRKETQDLKPSITDKKKEN